MNVSVMKRKCGISTCGSAKHRTRRRLFAVTAAGVLSAVLVACTEPPPTINPVQPIDTASLTKIVSDDNFNGFLVAFAAWCPPCKEELPDLAKLYLKYRDRGIRVVAMSLDNDGPKAVQPLINRLKIPFPVYWVGGSAMASYGLVGIPTLIVIEKGKVVEKRPGRQSRRELERSIKTLIEAVQKTETPT